MLRKDKERAKLSKIDSKRTKIFKFAIFTKIGWISACGWGLSIIQGVMLPLGSIFYFDGLLALEYKTDS
jgi:hypothetical protein